MDIIPLILIIAIILGGIALFYSIGIILFNKLVKPIWKYLKEKYR